jgi:predicted metalloprotease
MRWEGRRQSTNIEDRRGRSIGRTVGIGGGIGTLVLVLFVMFLGGDPTPILNSGPAVQVDAPQSSEPYQESAEEKQLREFISVVLADTEDTWDEIFRQLGGTYEPPALVLFTNAVQSACGAAPAAAGPFYCPLDRKVYLDLSFYREMSQRFGAPGDFAFAYVVAHEVGHHVQTLLGISEQTIQLRQRMSQSDANALSVRQELQADCFAGIWGHNAQRSRQLLEDGDIEEALNAAAAIGDDRLQRQSGGWVNPESFTHGSSEQRVRWFRRGIELGQVNQCDTFGADPL